MLDFHRQQYRRVGQHRLSAQIISIEVHACEKISSKCRQLLKALIDG